MGCCKKGPTKEELKGMVPDEHRKCQDCFCFILFVLFWIGMIVIAAISIASGDPNRLLYGVDYQGNTCGQGDMSGKKRIVYPRLSEDLLLNMQDGKIKTNPLDYKFYGICVNECPYASYVLCNADDPLVTDNMSQQQRLHCIDDPNDSTPQCESVRENCWYIPLNMSSIFWRCLPDYVVTKGEDVRCVFPSGVKDANDPACILRIDETNGTVTRPAQPNLLYDKINQARSLWGRWVGDVARSWWVVALCGVGLALFFGLVYLLLLRWCAGVMVFLTIVLVFVMLIAFTFFCYVKAGIFDPTFVQDALDQAGDSGGTVSQQLVPSSTNKTKFKYAAYLMTAITIVLLLIVFAIRQSIVNAVHIISQAAKALSKNFGLVFYPLVTVSALFALMVYFVFVGAAMMSAGDKVSVDNLASDIAANVQAIQEKYPNYANVVNVTTAERQTLSVIEPLTATRYLFAYHFFGLLWTAQVIQGIGMMTIAGVIANYYFNRGVANPVAGVGGSALAEDGSAPKKGRCGCCRRSMVCISLRRALTKNFGSIVFGSLLIAIIQFIRIIFQYIQNQMKNKTQNKSAKLLMKCVGCLLWCLELCLKFITRNAFIYMAVKGTSFYTSAKASIMLIMANVVDLAVVNTIGEILMVLGKLFVTCTCAFIAYYIMNNYEGFQADGDEELSSLWLPVLITMIFAFFVASAFFYVVDIAIDTILLCFCIDKKENDGVPVHMTLEGVVGKRALTAARAAKKHNGDDDGESGGIAMTTNPARTDKK